MHMTISELGSLGEFISSIAVLLSLIFVGYQLRHNALATKASIRQASFDSTLSFHTVQIDPVILAKAQFKLRTGEELSEFELDQYGRLQHMNLRGFESRYFQHQQGLIDDEMWLRSRSIIWGTFNNSGSESASKMVQEMWVRLRPSFPREFVIEVEGILKIEPREARQLWVESI